MSDVLDTKSRLLAQADDPVRAFATLAGPVVNGYGFCGLAKQQETHAKAIAWVEANPYGAMFMERMPALPGDRTVNLKRGLANARERAAKERAYFEDAKTGSTLRRPQGQRYRRQVLLKIARDPEEGELVFAYDHAQIKAGA